MPDLLANQKAVDLISRQTEEIIRLSSGDVREMMAVSMSVVISLLFAIAQGDGILAADLLDAAAQSSSDRLRQDAIEKIVVPTDASVH